MAAKGRPVRGPLMGLLLGVFLGIDLLLFKVVATYSLVLAILPAALFVLGVALGIWGPLGRRR